MASKLEKLSYSRSKCSLVGWFLRTLIIWRYHFTTENRSVRSTEKGKTDQVSWCWRLEVKSKVSEKSPISFWITWILLNLCSFPCLRLTSFPTWTWSQGCFTKMPLCKVSHVCLLLVFPLGELLIRVLGPFTLKLMLFLSIFMSFLCNTERNLSLVYLMKIFLTVGLPLSYNVYFIDLQNISHWDSFNSLKS